MIHRLLITFILTISSTITYSSDQDITNLMTEYLSSIHKKDQVTLKRISSKKYYKLLEKNYLNSKIKQTKKFNPKGFDIKILKASVDKNMYFVNLKDKKVKAYSEFWYIVEKKDKKYKITDMRHLED